MAGTRIQIAYPGEHYSDLLQIEAWIKDRTVPSEAQSLLCSALMKRQATRDMILDRLADKRGITRKALEQQILTGNATHMTQDEYAEFVSDSEDSE